MEEIASAMTTDSKVLREWVSINQLFVNENKTIYVVFSKTYKKIENIENRKHVRSARME